MNIFEKVKALDLPLGEYVVVASGAMEAAGIREAGDADIAVTPSLFAKLREGAEWNYVERYGKPFLKREGYDIIGQLNWPQYTTTTAEAIASATVIDGVAFMNLEELIKFKRALGREKDFADIALIIEHLNR